MDPVDFEGQARCEGGRSEGGRLLRRHGGPIVLRRT